MNTFLAYFSVTALMVTSLLLIFIILLQRGRGGGLAGAFGGAGGQSALGTKAGDVFTKITVGLAVFWVFLACLSIYALRAGSEGRIDLPTESEAALTSPGDAEVPDKTDSTSALGGADSAATPSTDGSSATEAESADGPSLPPAGDTQSGDSPEQP